MISIIVIGLNEAIFLKMCLDSVYEYIANNTNEYEVIYVDSGSVENNIQIASDYSGIIIIELTGDKNSAIARNVGASIASGENLVFLDGDMVLQQEFSNRYLNEKQFSKTPLFSGDILNYFYDSNYKYLSSEYYWRTPLKKDKWESKTGGVFCVTKTLWKNNNGMKNYYRRTQDNDFGLRLAANGFKLLRKKEAIVVHNTISYTNADRLFKILKDGDFFYKGLLYRENIFNKGILNILISTDYSLIILIVTILCIIITSNIKLMLLYFLFAALRSIRVKIKYAENFFNYYFYITVRDFQVFLSFLFFYPSKTLKVNYKIVNT